MKLHHFVAGAAAVALAAAQAQAAPSEWQGYAARAQAKADAQLRDAGVDLRGQTVSVRATVAPDGRLTGLNVVKSSGSPDTDRAVKAVLSGLIMADAPLGLIDGAVTLNVAEAPHLATQTP